MKGIRVNKDIKLLEVIEEKMVKIIENWLPEFKKQLQRRITGLFTLRRLTAPRGYGLLGHYATLHFHANLHSQFFSPANLLVCLSGLKNRRKQPERYMT